MTPDLTALARPFLFSLAASLLSGLTPILFRFGSTDAVHRADGVLHGFWTLALPILVTYALLRHHLFDIDIKFRATLRRGAVATIFVSVFFAASEATQTFVSDRWGPLVGIAATSLLVPFVTPLQKRAERFAEAAVPLARQAAEWSQDERLTFYREQVHIAWGDGGLNVKERALLYNLRDKMGISAEAAERIERDAISEHWLRRAPAAPNPAAH